MFDSRAVLLTLALEATPVRVSCYARLARHKTAYVATLVMNPDDFRPVGLYETESGVDVLWRFSGNPRLAAI